MRLVADLGKLVAVVVIGDILAAQITFNVNPEGAEVKVPLAGQFRGGDCLAGPERGEQDLNRVHPRVGAFWLVKSDFKPARSRGNLHSSGGLGRLYLISTH